MLLLKRLSSCVAMRGTARNNPSTSGFLNHAGCLIRGGKGFARVRGYLCECEYGFTVLQEARAVMDPCRK
jgi:hypothetical protein